MRRATAAAAALLALLALASLALPAEGRTLKKSQAERDAEALAEQQVRGRPMPGCTCGVAFECAAAVLRCV